MNLVVARDEKVAKNIDPEIAIEAEWGNGFINGSEITLNHHGVNSYNPPPCVAVVAPIADRNGKTVVFSHIDLDSIGGCLNVIGSSLHKNFMEFWKAVAFIDVNGPHKMGEIDITDEVETAIYAYWAFSQKPENRLPRFEDDQETIQINDLIQKHVDALESILVRKEKEFIENGKKFKHDTEQMNTYSFIEETDGVILREYDGFVNHLYTTPEGKICSVVINHNKKYNSVTISKAEDNVPINCLEIMQSIFGSKAGGHPNIAGSPRNNNYSLDDAEKAYCTVLNYFKSLN